VAEGHVTDVANTGAEGLRLARTGDYALAILDRMLPDLDGIELCRQFRLEGLSCRVLVLTARDALADKVGGLRAGADDYLTKPFAFDEFVARIEALLRRGGAPEEPGVLRVADLTLDCATRRATRGGRLIELTPKEYTLLRYLMENAGIVISRAQLLNNNWGYGFDPGTKVLDVYIRYLRRKIDDGEAVPLIHTVRGAGYQIGVRE
jgi:DNA-binding response OmpR family regulator